MPRFPMSLLFCLCAGAACAQPGLRAGPGDTPADARAQRRVELREVLKTTRQAGPDAAPAIAPTNVPPAGRHLTLPERIELREQLRREQNENRRNRK